jgi:hypothetical protein
MFYSREFSILFWFNRNLALPESDSQNLEFIADSEALLKISDKSVSNHALKITAHENCVALSIILSIINQKTNHHKQKTIKKINLWKYACSCFSSLFYAVSSKCRGAEKAKRNHSEYNWNWNFKSLQFDREELNAEKIFFKKSII